MNNFGTKWNETLPCDNCDGNLCLDGENVGKPGHDDQVLEPKKKTKKEKKKKKKKNTLEEDGDNEGDLIFLAKKNLQIINVTSAADNENESTVTCDDKVRMKVPFWFISLNLLRILGLQAPAPTPKIHCQTLHQGAQ